MQFTLDKLTVTRCTCPNRTATSLKRNSMGPPVMEWIVGLWSWPLYSNPASSSWFRLHRSLGLGGSQGWISESSRRTLGTDSLLMAEAERQLVVVVEGTAVLRPYWSTILTDYIEKQRGECSSSPLLDRCGQKLGVRVSWRLGRS